MPLKVANILVHGDTRSHVLLSPASVPGVAHTTADVCQVAHNAHRLTLTHVPVHAHVCRCAWWDACERCMLGACYVCMRAWWMQVKTLACSRSIICVQTRYTHAKPQACADAHVRKWTTIPTDPLRGVSWGHFWRSVVPSWGYIWGPKKRKIRHPFGKHAGDTYRFNVAG